MMFDLSSCSSRVISILSMRGICVASFAVISSVSGLITERSPFDTFSNLNASLNIDANAAASISVVVVCMAVDEEEENVLLFMFVESDSYGLALSCDVLLPTMY